MLMFLLYESSFWSVIGKTSREKIQNAIILTFITQLLTYFNAIKGSHCFDTLIFHNKFEQDQLKMDASSHLRAPSKAQVYISQSISRNAMIFSIIMLLLQIGLSLIYGFLINVQVGQLNVGSVVICIGLAILVIAGFGLVFGYTRRLAWSGIGFTFFITAFCIEVYPLINDFWVKTRIQSNYSPGLDFSNDNKNYNLVLTDRETGLTYYGNSLTNSLKCALSVAIAFSAVLGRVGHLECLVVAALGAVGFQLNRQIIQQNQGTDTFGTFYIFTFGGFMGLGLGLITLIRQNRVLSKLDRASMRRYIGSQHTVLYAIFGSLIIFALFPLLAYEIDAISHYNKYSPYANPSSILVAMGAGAIGAIMISTLINGYLIARDAIHGPIAGAIACGASSLYITNPVYAFIAGITGGICQSFIQNIIEKNAAKKKWVLSTVSWSLFGFQGLIGAAFAAGWKAIIFTKVQNSMTVQPAILNQDSQFQFYGGLISAGIGAAFGLVIGLLILLINGQKSREYFQDYFYWFTCDGIRYDIEEQIRPIPAKYEVQPKPQRLPEPEPEPQPEPERKHEPRHEPKQQHKPVPLIDLPIEEEDEFDFSVANENVPNPYAYL